MKDDGHTGAWERNAPKLLPENKKGSDYLEEQAMERNGDLNSIPNIGVIKSRRKREAVQVAHMGVFGGET
jgi:hypothetical protein